MKGYSSNSLVKIGAAFAITFFICLTNSACTQDVIETGYEDNIGFIAKDYLYEDSVIVVAHWNIGHFSKGKAPNTTISPQETDSLAALYKTYLNQAGANIMGICEYNSTFSIKGENTAGLLFSNFPYKYIGRQYSYNCNSIFSHLPLHNCHYVHFPICIQRRYYTVSDVVICGTIVKFVETHLDFNQGSYGNDYRLSQMQELVEAFKDSPHVIICADFNSSIREEYDAFRYAGFSFATDSLPNAGYTSSNTTKIMIDNILVKGFEIKETKVFPHMSLSDHDMICSKLLLKD